MYKDKNLVKNLCSFFCPKNINLDIVSRTQSHLIKYRNKVFKNISAAGKG